MQVLMFMGENFYPRKHFEDLKGVLHAVPSAAEIAEAVRTARADQIEKLGAGEIDWVDILAVNTMSAPLQYYWKVGHNSTEKQLQEDGFQHCWQDSDGYWHGVCELKRRPQSEADIEYGSSFYYDQVKP